MQPEARIPPPQRDGKATEKMSGADPKMMRPSERWPSLPMALTVLMVSSARLPKVSATTGTNSIPADLQEARWEDSLH